MMRIFFILFFLFPLIGHAQLQVAEIFTDNMVLQRNQPVNIWGKGVPGKQVEVLFGKEVVHTITEADSLWQVSFNRQPANEKPQSLLISSGNEKIHMDNILVGDVWLCIGQSNMEFPMKNEKYFKEELPHSRQPALRFYNPGYAGKNIYGTLFTDSILHRLTPDKFFQGAWQTSDSSSLKNMSAVGYYFGKQIAGEIKVPVGLIHLAIGGAPIETYISRKALQDHEAFAGKVSGNWLFNDALPVWVRQRGKENIGGRHNVQPRGGDPNHPFKPGFAFESGIEPILHFPIKGVLWYQGESNAQEPERVREYGRLFQLMVNDYRKKWDQPALPFYWVQLSSIDTAQYDAHYWPQFRDEQRKLLDIIPGGGMAVSSDVGERNDVHPADKKTVGGRLARWALARTYKKAVVPSGPLPLKATYENGKVVISFQYADNGLYTADGKGVRGFSLDGKTGAEAVIRNRTIVITAKQKPAFVYYGWQPFTDANLVNSAALPASTFKIKVF